VAEQQSAIEADFVVIGAGSAGCAVAARLSEDPAARVVLLEAGGEDTNRWIHIPLGFGKTFADPSVNWCYETEPDPGAADRRVFWPRGKVLGGSSSINGMVYIRGQAEDFDHWRQLGNTGWSFDDVLPYFRRCEDQTRGADSYHGSGGPLAVSDVERHPIAEAFIAAALAAGFPRNDDFNGASQDGVGYHQTTTRNGRRCSTAVGYLRPAMRRPNLQVITEALTERILFEGQRAIGVAFRRGGQSHTVRAAREVIVCSGAVNSPQLLMLSGIGPQPHLAEFGIPVVQHLPGVGQGLQDHYSAAVKLKARLPVTVNDVMLSNARKLKAGLQYYVLHKGPLAMISSPAALFARTRPELASPDVKCSISPFSADRPQDGLHKWSGFTMIAYQLRPDSRGEIRLKSANPDDPAGHASQLPDRRDRPAHHRRRVEDLPPAARQPTSRAIHRLGIPARPGPPGRRRAARLRAPAWRHGLSPDQHVQDGRRPNGGGRPGIAGLRHRRPARRRRLCDADRHLGQHQRRRDHDRRTRRRFRQPRGQAGGLGQPRSIAATWSRLRIRAYIFIALSRL
jgi:choline dehydrogenase